MSTAICPLILPVNTKDIQGNPHKYPYNHPQNNTTGGNGISSQSIRSGAENPAFPRPKKLRRAASVCRGSLAGGQRVGREELDARGVARSICPSICRREPPGEKGCPPFTTPVVASATPQEDNDSETEEEEEEQADNCLELLERLITEVNRVTQKRGFSWFLRESRRRRRRPGA